MSLPTLSDWNTTREGLHQASQVIGAVRAAVAAPEPNWTHLGLTVLPQGLSTGKLPSVGELVLEFTTLTIVYHPPDHDPAGFALALHTQRSLADAVEQGVAALGHPVALPRDRLTGETVFDFDPRLAADYARVLHSVSETFKRFRASLPGPKTPAIVWPHGFDLSFLWFATDQASEEAPHMAYGFSPGSAGLDRPYIYTYIYPLPENVTGYALPPHARWHTQGWTGTVTAYDDLVNQQSPEAVIEQTLRTLHETLAPALR